MNLSQSSIRRSSRSLVPRSTGFLVRSLVWWGTSWLLVQPGAWAAEEPSGAQELAREIEQLQKLTEELNTLNQKREAPAEPEPVTQRPESPPAEPAPPKPAPRKEPPPTPKGLTIVSSRDAHGHRMFSIDAARTPLSSVLACLAHEADCKLLFDGDLSPEQLDTRVSVHLEWASLEEALELLLSQHDGLEHRIEEGALLIGYASRLTPESEVGYLRQEAAKAYRRAILKSPNSPSAPRAYFEIGKYYFGRGGHSMALQQYTTILKEHPESAYAPQTLFEAAKCYRALDAYSDARQSYLALADGFRSHELADDALVAAGDMWLRLDRPDNALGIYANVIAQYSTRNGAVLAQKRIAYYHLDKGNHAEALKAFVKLRDDYPSDEHTQEAKYQIGNCLYHLEQYEKAESALRRFLTEHAQGELVDRVLLRLADCLCKQGHYADAVLAYESALQRFPKRPFVRQGRYSCGRAYQEMGLHTAAIRLFRQAVPAAGSPEAGEALAQKIRSALAHSHLERGEFERARQIFMELARSASDPSETRGGYLHAAECSFREKRYEPAAALCHKALRAAPAETPGDEPDETTVSLWRLWGDSLQRLGRIESALQAYAGELAVDE